MGWQDGVLQQAVNTCTNPSGMIGDCPVFDIQPRHDEEACKMPTPPMLKNEMVAGLVGAGLPGGVMIQEGPAPATAKHPVTQTASVSIPTVTYTPGVTPTGTLNLPGQILHETTSSTSSSADINALAQPATTPAPIPTPKDDGKYSIVRTEYITSSNVVNMIVVKEAVEYVTVTTTTVLAPKARRHLHRHGRRRQH